MVKKTIEIDVPEGKEVLEVHSICIGRETGYDIEVGVKLKKTLPRRRVFECVSEEPRSPKVGDWIEDTDGHLYPCFYSVVSKYKIFREVEE